MKNENIELVHCPMERMIADFFTKALQGSLFRKMRDIIMGLAPFPAEERVEENSLTTVALGQNHNRDDVKMTYAEAVKKQVSGKERNDVDVAT